MREFTLSRCELCPRACGADREAGAQGACTQDAHVSLARAALHFWEEPPLSARAGSGTVFFSGCPLHCVYCQNADISNGSVGKAVSVKRLAQIFLELQAQGANNINLVTPTHFAPHIIEALGLAHAGELMPRPAVLERIASHPETYPYARLDHVEELRIPIIYNTSGYERVEVIEALAGSVDVFLTDFKYASPELAYRYSRASDYPRRASEALDAMVALVGPARFTHDMRQDADIMQSGVIVRHLLLPGHLDDSFRVVDMLAAKPYSADVWVSLMSQYTPMPRCASAFPKLAEPVSEEAYLALVDYALASGLENSFMQQGGAATDSFIPVFDYEGV